MYDKQQELIMLCARRDIKYVIDVALRILLMLIFVPIWASALVATAMLAISAGTIMGYGISELIGWVLPWIN